MKTLIQWAFAFTLPVGRSLRIRDCMETLIPFAFETIVEIEEPDVKNTHFDSLDGRLQSLGHLLFSLGNTVGLRI